MNLHKRLKQRAVKIKCSREKRKEMMLLGRYCVAYGLSPRQEEIFKCPVYIQYQCYWSKPK